MGADLALARERLGREIDDLAAALRIRAPYLRALEEGRIAELPGNAYALAFLRTYGVALGLDADELSRRFKAEAAALVTRKTELAFPAPVPERGIPAGAVMMLGLMLAVGAYAGWYRLSGEGRLPAETVAPVPAHLSLLAEQAVPPTMAEVKPAPQVTPAPAPAPAPAPPAQQLAAAVPDPVPALSPTSAAAATPPATQPPPAPVAPAVAEGAPPPALALHASVDSWIQVRERGGQVVFSRILRAGETWPVPETPDLLLTTGNAGGTQLVLDGVAMPALGGLGVVRRDLPLDPEAVRSGRLAPATTATR